MTMIRIRLTCKQGVEHPTHVAATKCNDGNPKFVCPPAARLNPTEHVTTITRGAGGPGAPRPPYAPYRLTCTCGLSRWCYLTKAGTVSEAAAHRRNYR